MEFSSCSARSGALAHWRAERSGMATDHLADLRESVESCLYGCMLGTETALGELTVRIQPCDTAACLEALRDNNELGMSVLIDICGVDWPAREPRFDVVYHLLSMSENARLRLKIEVGENEPVPSATGVFPAANWYEREVFDMYGIEFEGHPDLRRILTDYGFRGHPLRKDFPLTGFVELRYDETRKRVAYEPVHLTQAYRDFDFLSPWEGARAVRQAEEQDEGA